MIDRIMQFLTPNEWLALANVFGVLLGVVGLSALLIWVERRLLSVWQDRYGPNRLGPLGLGQVVADMIKIFFKEDWIPPFVEKTLFIIAPMIIMASLLVACAIVPFAPNVGVIDLNIGLLYFLAMTSLGVYSIMLAGWSSNSKYALLGGLRSSAQMITYEVFMGVSLLGVVMLAGSFNLREIVQDQAGLWNIVRQPLGFLVFFIAGIAETHRAPLDLPEAEQELASGFHTEYSGMKFGMFFVGEYVGIILNSAMVTTLFLGGWMGPFVNEYPMLGLFYFIFKVLLLICFFILMRAGLVRPRYDQLMAYGWKVMLPLALLNVLITGAVILGFNK